LHAHRKGEQKIAKMLEISIQIKTKSYIEARPEAHRIKGKKTRNSL